MLADRTLGRLAAGQHTLGAPLAAAGIEACGANLYVGGTFARAGEPDRHQITARQVGDGGGMNEILQIGGGKMRRHGGCRIARQRGGAGKGRQFVRAAGEPGEGEHGGGAQQQGAGLEG